MGATEGGHDLEVELGATEEGHASEICLGATEVGHASEICLGATEVGHASEMCSEAERGCRMLSQKVGGATEAELDGETLSFEPTDADSSKLSGWFR